ncbi:hypothetical protein [Macrococcus animalis]|uniref:hypothetical protein n=1 Tax=Macrococcus animalis TaxID=3395467 RepID=UPI0039BE7444
MPYEKGGRADKEGNKFEIKWVLLQLLNILMENIEYIALESLGEDEKGVDLWIGKKDGTREGQQCKARNGSKEYWDYSSLNSKDILTNWKLHLERDQDISVSLVSPLSFTFLEDLNKRALNSSEDSKTFYKYQIEPSSKSFKNFYNNILSSLNINSEKDSFKIINYLKRIMYHQIPDSTLDDIIFHYMDCLFKSDKDTAYDSFISWVISGEIIGKRVDINDIYDFLNNKNIYLRDLANDQRIFPRINQLNREYRDTFKSIQDNLKIRSIFETCKNRLIKGDSLIIHGKAGVGKSGLTMNIIDYCIDERIPYLALKLDNRIPKNNAEQWGSDIGLPASIPFCIDSLSKNKRVVLILDQLDILRWTQSHSREALLVCKEIINQIEKINKDRDNKISLIFVCRTFDLENDNNLKSLFENSGENNYGMNWTRIQVEEFDDLTVKQIVGPRYNKITSKLKTLLRTPSNLYIWSQLDIRSNYAECSTTNHLITEWWNQLLQNAHRNQLNTRELENTKKELVNWLEKNNRIYAPLKVLRTGQAYLDFLTSNSFFNIDNSKISFAHQSILDCLLAEEMLNNYYKGYEITQIIGEKNKQTPVRRYQLQIFLELLLEYDSADFIRVGVQIFESDNIRYFFKYVFLETLSQIDNIDENIKLFILDNCENKIFELLLIKYVYINKPKYIDLLISENIFNKWLLNSELKKYVYILLESINTSHTIISTNFIKENLFSQREDDEMFISCFPYDIKFDLDSLFDLRMEFYEKYPHFVNPYIDFLDLLESHEMRAIRLLELIIRKKQNIKGEKLYIDNEKVFNKKNYGIKEERKILDFLIPLIPIENGISQFSEWSEYTTYEKGIERFCIKIIKEANINLIKSDPNEFWEYYNNYIGKGYDLFNEILLDGFKYLPKNFSNKVIEYLILDFENNIFICTDGSGNQLSLFKQNIYKHMATCDQEVYDRSLKKINEYMPNDILSRYKSRLIYSMENNVNVYRNFCEDFQKEIYEALPYSRLSSSDRRKKLALQRKFPNKTRYDISNKIYSGIVISPIKNKKIKVKQWLEIFTNKKILNRNPLHWSESFIDNSINGFADSFRDSVSENPSDLIRLVIEYKDFINNKYIDSLFSGVANSDNVKKYTCKSFSNNDDRFKI